MDNEQPECPHDNPEDWIYRNGVWKHIGGLTPTVKGQVLNPNGRPKGSKNRKTLRQELIDNGKFTPAEFLVSIVNDENANMNQRIRAAESAAKYYDPALASVEMHTDKENKVPFNITLTDKPEPKEPEDPEDE